MWNIEKVVSKGDYNYAVVRKHPNATKNGYVLEHRVIVENRLGRVLNTDGIVHHINGDKKDNRDENLEVLTNSQHASHHNKTKGRKFALIKCPNCEESFEKEYNKTHIQKGTKATFCSRKCAGIFWTTIGLTNEVHNAISGNIVSTYTKYAHDNREETFLQEVP